MASRMAPRIPELALAVARARRGIGLPAACVNASLTRLRARPPGFGTIRRRAYRACGRSIRARPWAARRHLRAKQNLFGPSFSVSRARVRRVRLGGAIRSLSATCDLVKNHWRASSAESGEPRSRPFVAIVCFVCLFVIILLSRRVDNAVYGKG